MPISRLSNPVIVLLLISFFPLQILGQRPPVSTPANSGISLERLARMDRLHWLDPGGRLGRPVPDPDPALAPAAGGVRARGLGRPERPPLDRAGRRDVRAPCPVGERLRDLRAVGNVVRIVVTDEQFDELTTAIESPGAPNEKLVAMFKKEQR